jgi:4-hydroxy-tetrahydrodipicolinate synthase
MKEGTMRVISILVGNNGLFLDFELERGVSGANTGYPFPEMLVETVRLSKSDNRDAAHDLFDSHLPLLRYEQQPGVGLAVRKYVLKLRGILSSDVQRNPGMQLTKAGYDEVNYLLSRVARHDPRANLRLATPRI